MRTSLLVSGLAAFAATHIGAAAVPSNPIIQRDLPSLEARDGDCSPAPAGTGPTVNNPDTAYAFEHNPYFTAAALAAPVPIAYLPSFINLNSSTSQSGYMGYNILPQYDTFQCASLCNKNTGCVAFNLYFERDPSLDPNAQACPNPPSLTNIKCVFWGAPITPQTATNNGQFRDQFQVVIAGSNGYNAITVPGGIHL